MHRIDFILFCHSLSLRYTNTCALKIKQYQHNAIITIIIWQCRWNSQGLAWHCLFYSILLYMPYTPSSTVHMSSSVTAITQKRKKNYLLLSTVALDTTTTRQCHTYMHTYVSDVMHSFLYLFMKNKIKKVYQKKIHIHFEYKPNQPTNGQHANE